MLLKTILYPKQNRKKPNANFPMGRECVTKRRGFCDRAESSNQLFFFLSLFSIALSVSLSLSLVVFFGGNSPFLSVLACYNLSWCHCDDAFSCFWTWLCSSAFFLYPYPFWRRKKVRFRLTETFCKNSIYLRVESEFGIHISRWERKLRPS